MSLIIDCILGNYRKGEDMAVDCVHGELDPSLAIRFPWRISGEWASPISLETIRGTLRLFHEMGLPLARSESKANVFVLDCYSTSVDQYAMSWCLFSLEWFQCRWTNQRRRQRWSLVCF